MAKDTKVMIDKLVESGLKRESLEAGMKQNPEETQKAIAAAYNFKFKKK